MWVFLPNDSYDEWNRVDTLCSNYNRRLWGGEVIIEWKKGKSISRASLFLFTNTVYKYVRDFLTIWNFKLCEDPVLRLNKDATRRIVTIAGE